MCVQASDLCWILEYLELFNCVQIIVILVCKQIGSDSFKDEINYKLLTYKSYLHNYLTVCETNKLWFIKKCYLQTLHLQILYKMYKEELALNNLQGTIYHKKKTTQPNHMYLVYIYAKDLALSVEIP